LNFVATYNIRSPEKDSEKNMVLRKKGDDITPFDGRVVSIIKTGHVRLCSSEPKILWKMCKLNVQGFKREEVMLTLIIAQ
jgi:hypothetical protein